MITGILNPQHIGARPGVPDGWQKEMDRLAKFKNEYVMMKVKGDEQIAFGTKVLWIDNSCKDMTRATESRQPICRGLIAAPVTSQNLQGLTKREEDDLEILVELIDKGIMQYVKITELVNYEADRHLKKSFPDLFTRYSSLQITDC